MMNPTLIAIAGVRKSGTTTLFDMLAKHSAISPAIKKESNFFACDRNTIRSNLSWYYSLFPMEEQPWILDGSTMYFGSGRTPELINEFAPNARIVLVLRDPAQRTFSGYLHMRKQSPRKEKRRFSKMLQELENRVQQGATVPLAEDEMMKAASRQGLIDANYRSESYHADRFNVQFRTILEDGLFCYRYFTESCYSQILPRWQGVFKDRLKIVFFEKMILSPSAVVTDVLDFLGLPTEPEVLMPTLSNRTRMPKGAVTGSLIGFLRMSRAGQTFSNALKAVGLRRLGVLFRESVLYGPKDKLSKTELASVRRLLASEYKFMKQQFPDTADLWS
jgi:hypothetical protein